MKFKPLLFATVLLCEGIYYLLSHAVGFKLSPGTEPDMPLKSPSVVRAERAAAVQPVPSQVQSIQRNANGEIVTAPAEDGSLESRWKKP